MPNLYVIEAGARVEIEYHRLLVTKDDEVLMRVPASSVTQVVLIGPVGITTPAMHHLMHNNIPVIFLSTSGKFLGQIAPAFSSNLPLRQQQYQYNSDISFCFLFAKNIVTGKIHNQFVQAFRWARRNKPITQSHLEKLKECEQQAAIAKDEASLLGVEGCAARIYFDLMKKIVDPAWGFINRNRRPPKDPINAMLGFGYTLLTYTACAALQIVGLDPYLGYYHVETYGRPALALDLIEEFRSPIIDSLVISMLNLHQIKPSDFVETGSEKVILMNTKARRTYIKYFNKKMNTPIKTRSIGRAISFQKHVEVQARKIASLIQGKTDDYESFRMR